MFGFLANPTDVDGPRFVFAHINKPHSPDSFDQYGNYIVTDNPKMDLMTVTTRRS